MEPVFIAGSVFSILKLLNTAFCKDTSVHHGTGKGQINTASKTTGYAKGFAGDRALHSRFSLFFWLSKQNAKQTKLLDKIIPRNISVVKWIDCRNRKVVPLISTMTRISIVV